MTLDRDGLWRYPRVQFSNNEKHILEYIAVVLQPATGYITKKKPRRANHAMGYDLTYRSDAALAVCALLVDRIRHLSKKARMKLLLDGYKQVTPRNGKYTSKQKLAKEVFEAEFFAIKCKGVIMNTWYEVWCEGKLIATMQDETKAKGLAKSMGGTVKEAVSTDLAHPIDPVKEYTQ